MKTFIPLLVLATSLLAVSGAAALAYDTNSDIRGDWTELHRDRAAVNRDVGTIRIERDAYAADRRHAEWAWWHGKYWEANQARYAAHEESSDLHATDRRLRRDTADVRDDRADLRSDYHRAWYRHWN